jgi:phosphatidylglycerol:prolipoprotein diacylglycerol transferase
VFPHDLQFFGAGVSIWNAAFLGAVLIGAVVFRACAATEQELTHPLMRYAVTVYLSALAAQVFAYAFDANTTLLPPPDVSAAAWYLSPVAGPKTLYGVIVLMPASVAAATVGTRMRLGRSLDLWTPAMFTVLAGARIGCLLQGCCYGARSDALGVSFPVGSPVYYQHLAAGLVAEGSASLAVVPTQAIEALVLGAVAWWSLAGRQSRPVFVPAVAAYSLLRFVLEFVRADVERGVYGGLATSQWIAMAVLAAAAVWARVTAAEPNA